MVICGLTVAGDIRTVRSILSLRPHYGLIRSLQPPHTDELVPVRVAIGFQGQRG